jgi:uncharacterized protein
MPISMYRASVQVFKRHLKNLDAILDKAAAWAETRKIDPNALLQARLAPDMFHLIRQVQIVSDQAKGTVARLAGQEPPIFEDNETSFADLKARIAKTITFIDGFQPAQIDDSADREIALPLGGQTLKLKGSDFLLGFGMPNFYFHYTTAYAILRHGGLEIGKTDYIGSSR